MDTTGTKYFVPYSRYPLYKGQNVDNAPLTIIAANSDKARMKKAVLIRGILINSLLQLLVAGTC